MDTHAITIKLAADIADLLSKMKIAESAVGGAVGKIKSSFNGMLATLGAGISIAGLAAFVKTAINSADALDEMSGRVGVSAKELSSLQLAFRQAGMSNEDMGTSLSKLSKQMADGNKMFDAMGVKVKNTDGTLRGTTSVLSDVADQFAGMQDGAGKTALAIELFGKSGAAMVPLLNGGSEGIREMTEMASKLGLVIEDSTAAQAGKFNDTLELLQLGVSGVGQGIAAQLLPTLNGLAGEFLTTMTSGDKLKNTADFLASALKILYIGGVGIVEVFSSVGKIVGGSAAAIMAALSGNFSEAKSIMSALSGDVKSGWTAAAASMKAAWETQGNAAVDAAAKGIGANRNLIAEQKKREEAEKAGASAAAAALKAQESFVKGLEKESDKLQLTTTQAKLKEAGLLGITGKTLEHVKAILKENDAFKASIEAAKESNKAFDDLFDAQEKIRLGNEEQIKTGRTMLDQIQFETRLIAMNAEQRAMATMERELERQGIVKGTQAYDAYIEKLREATAIKGIAEAGKKVNDEQVADWKKTIDQYDDIFRTGFSGMINGGQGAWKSFTKSLATTFKTSVADQIYKSFAQPFVVKFVASMLGVTGVGSAMASEAGGSIASSLGISAAISKAGAYVAEGASTVATAILGFGADALAFEGGMAMMGSATGVTSFMAGAGQAMAAMGPVGWAALAAVAVIAAMGLEGGETRNGAQYGVGTNGLATKLEGPSGGEIASKQAREMFDITKASIEGMLTGLGSKAVLTGFTAGLESSENGKGFAYATGQINGQSFGDVNTYMNNRGDKTQEQALADYKKELSQSILEALQVTADIPASVAKLISTGLNGAEVKDLTLEASNAILASIETLSKSVTVFGAAMQLLPFERLKTLSFDATAGLLAAAGGFDALAGNLAGFYQGFFTAEEQRAQSISNTSAAFEALGLTMPALDEGARAAFKAMVLKAEAELDGTDATAKAYASLLALQGPMNQLAPAFDSIAQSAVQAAATMTSAWASVMQSRGAAANDVTRFTAQAAIDAAFTEFKKTDKFGIANAAQFETITQSDFASYSSANQQLIATIFGGFADLRAANAPVAADTASTSSYTPQDSYTPDTSIADAIAQITKGLTDAGVNLGVELLKAQGKTVEAMAAQRAIDTAGYNAAQIALYDYNQTLRDQITALGEAATKTAAIASERKGLQDQYDTLTLTSAELLAKQRDALDETNRALFDNIQLEKAKDAVANERKGLQDQLNGLTDTAAQALTRQRDALDASNRALFDNINAVKLAATNAGLREQLSVLDGSKTQQQVDRARQLADATDASTKAIIRQIHAQEDLQSAQGRLESAKAAITTEYLAAQDQLASAQNSVANAQKSVADAARQAAQEMMGFGNSILDFLKTLETTSAGNTSPESRYQSQSSEFQKMAELAKNGDKTALSKITGAAGDYLGASKDYYASGSGFTADEAMVKALLSQVIGVTGSGTMSAIETDPVAAAQADLVKALERMSKANELISASGSSTSAATVDLLGAFLKAQEDVAKATADAATWRAADAAAWVGRDSMQGTLTQASLATNLGVIESVASLGNINTSSVSIQSATQAQTVILNAMASSSDATRASSEKTAAASEAMLVSINLLVQENRAMAAELGALRQKVSSMESTQRLAASAPAKV